MLNIELQTISDGYDRKTCWTHARPGLVSIDPLRALVCAQQLLIRGDDVFYEVNSFHTDDGGKTWTGPVAHPETMGRHRLPDGSEEAICDLSPMWHAKTGTLLATGLNGFYRGDVQLSYPDARRTCYSVYNAGSRSWAQWRKLTFPNGITPFIEGAGCTQRVDLPNGDILLPTYSRPQKASRDDSGRLLHSSTVMRCRFDGCTLEYIEHGTELTRPEGRGFVEPSLVNFQGRFFLTLRNDYSGYVASSNDGLHYGTPHPWTFDDGSDLGSYNTQQHWVTGGGSLYLVYTRRGANNDHVMRHRAPLFIAKVDPERLHVIRETEQVLVPEHGARLGNFGVAQISGHETWVSVAEWMQTKLPDPSDSTVCEKYGSNNRIFVAKITFS